MKKSLAKRDPVPELGPAMRVLPARWQSAVQNLFLVGGDQTKALRLAGYKGKPASLNVMASRVFADDRVRAAVKELCGRYIDICEPELLSIVQSIMRDSGEKASDRLRAASMIWDRANPVQTRHNIQVEHVMTDNERDIAHYRGLKAIGAPPEAFIARFGPNGLPRVEALILAEEAKQREIEGGPVIEVEYTEAPEEEEPAATFDDELLA